MEKDQRLTPLPNIGVDLQAINQEYPAAYAPFYDDETFDEKRTLRQYFTIVYKRLPLILALVLLTTAVAAFYMYRQPSMYQATTEMIVEPPKPKGVAGGPININFGNDSNYYNTQLQLLKNSELMKDVVVALGLQRQPNLFNNQSKGLLESMRSFFSRDKTAENAPASLPIINESQLGVQTSSQPALTTEENDRAENYAGVFLGGLTVDQVPTTNLVHITIANQRPDLAASVADKVAENFIENDINRETEGAKKTYEGLTKSIEDLKTTINGQDAQLIDFMRNGGNVVAGEKGDVSNGILQTVSSQWLAARDKRAEIEASYTIAQKNIAAGKGEFTGTLSDSPIYQNKVKSISDARAKLQDTLRDYDNRINSAENELSQLRVKYTDDNPKVEVKLAQITQLKESRDKIEKETNAKIESEVKKTQNDAEGGALTALKSQLDAATTRENQALNLYMSEAQKANLQGQAEIKLTNFRHELDTNRALLDDYTKQQKQQELLIAGSRPDNLKISNHAIVPTAPIGPQRTRNIFIAFLVSLVAGIGLAFLMDYLDDSVKTSDDVGRHLGLPTLALIPHQNLIDKRKLTDLALSKNGGGGGGGGGSMTLITIQDQRSPMAEAYRHLRTSLLFSSAGKPPQTILITSSQPSEGKTTTAINTAVTLAQSDADVVIIDCDLRRPRLHSHFSMENTHGLTNYLSGEKNTAQLLKPCRDLPKLKVITSGPIPPNPAELLSSNEMKNLLQFLRGNFKHIIIDSPPAISFTDAAILSTQVDGVVLVAMAGKSSLHLMRRFKQRLGSIGARIYGVVLNGVKANSMEYDYYGSAYSYYGAPEDDSTPLMEETAAMQDDD